MMKKVLGVLFAMLVFGTLGCATYGTIPYPENLKNSTIQATVTVQVAEPVASAADMGIFVRNKFINEVAPLVVKCLKEADLKGKLASELKNTDFSSLKKVNVVVDNKAFNTNFQTIPLTDAEKESNKFITKYSPESLKSVIKTPYILDVNVVYYEYYAYKKAMRYVVYVAIYRVDDGMPIWGETLVGKENESLLSSIGREKIETKEYAEQRISPFVKEFPKSLIDLLKD